MSRLILSVVTLFFVIFGVFPVDSRQSVFAEEKGKVSFRWAFGAMVGPRNDRRLVAITRDTILKTGDQLKMLVELQKKCFIYLFYNSEQKEVHLLFPYDLNQFTTDYKNSKKYYIPQGNMWFELDKNVGLETFYLLASSQRLIDLEELYRKYNSADPLHRRELAEQIVAEIRKIRRRHRKFTTTAERPVSIGGNVRGIPRDEESGLPDIEPIAGEVSAADFYSRTFTIDHR